MPANIEREHQQRGININIGLLARLELELFAEETGRPIEIPDQDLWIQAKEDLESHLTDLCHSILQENEIDLEEFDEWRQKAGLIEPKRRKRKRIEPPKFWPIIRY